MSEMPPSLPPMDRYEPESSKLATLRTAAIILIVVGALAIVTNLYYVLSASIQVARGMAQIPPGPHPQGFEFGFYAGFYGPLFAGILALPLLIIMIFGAVAMIRRKSYGFARLGAILAILPFTASCCCIATLPLGIWTLILLNNPEVKAAFQTNAGQVL